MEATSSAMGFSLLGSGAPVLAPRVGNLALPGRKAIATPHHVPLTSRGTVPHIAHDVMRDHTAINSIYAGMEDFIEKKKDPAVYKVPATAHESPLRKFICMAEDMPLIFGPRRFPAIPCPPANTSTSIAVLTSVGFRQLSTSDYVEAVQQLRPDIIIGMADMASKPPGNKRRAKMIDRTHAWTQDALEKLYGESVLEKARSKAAFFAPILPVDNTQQSLYLEGLESDHLSDISGLALYQSPALEFVPESLSKLPRLLLSESETPHQVLREVSLGADLLTTPFVGVSSDAGILLEFTFPTPAPKDGNSECMPLGVDMWSSEHTTDTSSLSEGCQCYACKNYNRAYVHHLLNAKEMTAWVLIQIHNFHIMDLFFAGIRASIQRATFEADVYAFNQAYVSSMPESTGQGPRLRGYQLPANGPNQPRRMPKMYGQLDQLMQKYTESQTATPDTDATGLEEHGFANKI